jgi:recombinational DNA repair ATPase RecF
MWLKTVQLKNTKAFKDSYIIEFSKEINLLVGANSAGKSTVLRAINLLQPPTGKRANRKDILNSDGAR